MGHRNLQRCRHRAASSDAGDNFQRNAGAAQGQHFLAAAPEYKRVAALDAADNRACLREAHHHAFDELLRCRFATATFADRDNARTRFGMLQHRRIHQIVDQQDIALPQRVHGFEREQFRIAGAGPDQIYLADGMPYAHAANSSMAPTPAT